VSTLVLLVTAATLSSLATLIQQRRWPRFRRFDFVAASGLALFTLAGNLAAAHAMQHISASLMTAVQRTEVLVVALLAWPLLGERVDRRFWLGAAVAATGFFVLQDPLSAAAPALGGDAGAAAAARAQGIGLAMAAACFFAGMAILTRRVIHQIDPVLVNALRLWISVGFWFAMNGIPDALREAPASQIAYAAAAGLLGPFMGRLSMMMSARSLEARVTVLFTLAAPPVTLVVAFFWLGDWPSAREIVGGCTMLAGVALALLLPERPERPETPEMPRKRFSPL